MYHHGVKGQKWGVRRYQYADGSYTPTGKKHVSIQKQSSTVKRSISIVGLKVSTLTKKTATKVTGKQYVDSFLKDNTSFKRIQTSKNFENFAFYATYKKHDSNKYMGLFGKNLKSRAESEANRAEKKAAETGTEEDANRAKDLRTNANETKVYQLSIAAQRKLKVPSDENAGHITANLLKEPEFKKNVEASIADSKEKMRRPTQKLLFNQAEKALTKEPSKMNTSDRKAVYKALNLSLVNHNPQEVAAQNRFYSDLKKKGYNALLDYNDKEYSSYHAKRPMIVFDTDSVKLQSVSETNPKVVNKLYKKYNSERLTKEIPANTIGYITKYGTKSVADCRSYVSRKMNDYLR